MKTRKIFMMWQKKFLARFGIILAVITAITLSLLLGIYLEAQLKKIYPKILSGNEDKPQDLYRVVEVLDGDTIKVEKEGRTEKVRLLGIDAEELNEKNENNKCFAKMAKNGLEEKIEGKDVDLIVDITQGEKDIYKRLLRDVYLGDEWINGWLVEMGLARVYEDYPSARNVELENLQQNAIKNIIGLWKGECFYE